MTTTALGRLDAIKFWNMRTHVWPSPPQFPQSLTVQLLIPSDRPRATLTPLGHIHEPVEFLLPRQHEPGPTQTTQPTLCHHRNHYLPLKSPSYRAARNIQRPLALLSNHPLRRRHKQLIILSSIHAHRVPHDYHLSIGPVRCLTQRGMWARGSVDDATLASHVAASGSFNAEPALQKLGHGSCSWLLGQCHLIQVQVHELNCSDIIPCEGFN